MIDHVTADLRHYEAEQDKLERLVDSISDADKEQIAQDLIADFLERGNDEEDLSCELAISSSDADDMIALNKHNRGAWLGIISQRAKTFWEDKIEQIYINDNKG